MNSHCATQYYDPIFHVDALIFTVSNDLFVIDAVVVVVAVASFLVTILGRIVDFAKRANNIC